MVGGHRQGEGEDGALGGGVQGALREPGGRGDGAGVHDRRVCRFPQVGQGGAGGTDHADNIDVQDPVPLVVGVVLDGALGADPGVVDQHVESAEVRDGRGHGLAYGGVVGDVGAETEQGLLDRREVQVEDGDPRPTGGEQLGGGAADAGGATGHQRLEPFEVGTHAASPFCLSLG